ncbi:MAG: amidohydrolase family protein [Candidatus Scalindua sp.]|jgi:cytosine/adenosine deaminase-related metal-dependent hydrolase|nr:amidohydrolase family protein [Candidatus Scalindua sp.]MDV5165747.1 amidohydrolase family protein [Candidatus Scalindua sp.]
MYILKSKYLLKDPDNVIENGALLINDGGKIKFAGQFKDIDDADSYKTIDLGNSAIVPGLINTHTHLELTNMHKCINGKGIFTDWIRQLIDAKKDWSESEYTLSIRDGIESSLKSGTTTIVDITRNGIALNELLASNIRKLLFFEIINFDPDTAEDTIKDFKELISGISTDDLLSIGIFPHAPYTVSDKLYRKCRDISEECNIRTATHIAETEDEVEFLTSGAGHFVALLNDFKMLNRWNHPGLSPINYLNNIGFLNNECILIHCNYLTEDEIGVIEKSKSNVVFCPRSHEFFRHKDHPFPSLKDRGINIALGTDSLASNDTLSILDEMKFIRNSYPEIEPNYIFKMGTIAGAVALQMDDCIGQLHPGYYADIAVIEFQDTDVSNIYDGIFSQDSECVLTIVSGEICYDKFEISRKNNFKE